MDGVKKIATIEEAIELLNVNGLDSKVNVQLNGELKTLTIEIEGPNFHGTLTGELARGLAEFQDEIYRAARFVLLEDKGRLNASQKEAFELEIEVEKGCTLINIDLGKIADAVSGALQNMTPGEITGLGVAIAAVLGASWLAKSWVAEHYKASTESKGQEEETKRLIAVTQMAQSLADPRVQRFAEAGATGVREVTARATGAVSVKVGRVEFDQDDIAALKKRSPRSTAEKISETGMFNVFNIEALDSTLKATINGSCVRSEFDAVVYKEDFSEDQLIALSAALSLGIPIELEIQAAQVGERIRGGVILAINPSQAAAKE